MPLHRDERGGGTNADGSKSTMYCSHWNVGIIRSVSRPGHAFAHIAVECHQDFSQGGIDFALARGWRSGSYPWIPAGFRAARAGCPHHLAGRKLQLRIGQGNYPQYGEDREGKKLHGGVLSKRAINSMRLAMRSLHPPAAFSSWAFNSSPRWIKAVMTSAGTPRSLSAIQGLCPW